MTIRFQIDLDASYFAYDRKATRLALRAAGNEIAAYARALIRSSRGTGPKHASLPGQAPANLSGFLASKIKVFLFKQGDGVAIRDMAYYSLFLEKGAHGGGGDTRAYNMRYVKSGRRRMINIDQSRLLLPRPFLSTVLDQQKDSIEARLKTAIMSGMKFERRKAPRVSR